MRTPTHQPGQAAFKSIPPEDIDWKPFPAFPPPARLAVVVGQPAEPGPYVIRVKVPSGVKLMTHIHWAKSGEYITQVTGIGPLGIEYLDPGDDPRRQNRQ